MSSRKMFGANVLNHVTLLISLGNIRRYRRNPVGASHRAKIKMQILSRSLSRSSDNPILIARYRNPQSKDHPIIAKGTGNIQMNGGEPC